ncbi:uncharacterized protein DS421_7g219480 [Arachis hypogaea]|nr:uncharacterized protein DS421_7g219480 [Arachis hypogaea]
MSPLLLACRRCFSPSSLLQVCAAALREELIEFGNNVDGRMREAQSHILDLERKILLLQEEFRKYKTYHELNYGKGRRRRRKGNCCSSPLFLESLLFLARRCCFTSSSLLFSRVLILLLIC